jgi:hypothetical protein
MHTELARFVVGRRDDAPLGRVAVAADDDRAAGEFGATKDLDGGDELVEIDVQHGAAHASSMPGPAPTIAM